MLFEGITGEPEAWAILAMLAACIAGLWAAIRLSIYKDTGVSKKLEWIVAICSIVLGMVSALFGGLMLLLIVGGILIIICILIFVFSL